MSRSVHTLWLAPASVLLSIALARGQASRSSFRGHVMGKVGAIAAGRLTIETDSGPVSVIRTNETLYESMNTPVRSADLQVGDRVMIEVVEQGEQTLAKIVRIGPTPRFRK